MEEYSSSGRRTPLLAGRGRAAARGSLVRSSSGNRVGPPAAASDGTGLAGAAVADADIRAGGSWGLSWEATAGSPTVAGDGGEREVSSTCSSSSSHGVAAAAGIAGGGHQARTLRAAAASSYTSSPDFSATAAASPWFAASPQPQRAPPAGALGLGTAAAVSEKLRRLWGGRGGASAAATEVDVELQRQQLGGHRGGAARRTVREVVTDDEEEDDEEDSLWFCYCLPQLTNVERLLGWLICFIGGLVISGLCVGSFYDLFRGRSMKFAVAYTLGNCVGLLGTTFLVGPARQLQGMADPSRLVTSCIFAASLFLTLFFSLFLPLPPLVIVCVCVQWLAYVWYSLSYIPYGQESVLWCMRAVAGRFR